MASRKEYEMLFQLDAKLGSSYTSTFSKAKSGPSELQKEIRSLQSVQADISAYTKQQAAVEKTQAKLDNLNKQYQLLQQEIKETNGPTTSLERESAKLEQRIGDTSNALAAQKEKLGSTAKSLNEAGVGTDNLGAKSQDLADKLNTLRAKEEAAAESAEEYGDKGTSSIEAVSQAFAAAKVYEALEQIKDAYMDCINSAGDFEASMSNVEALSGASGDQLQALTDKAKEMGATTKFTAGESADALSYMALAGWDTQSMLQGISPVMELAAAANMDLASASDIVTDYLTAFGLTASDTTHFVDVMAYAMSHSNTNVEQLGEAYKACAATAKSMGYSVEETTAVLATMANAGVKGGEAGTALNAIMTRLATNTKGCADELEKYGVSIYDSQGNMNSLSDILTGLSAVWDNLTDQEQANLAKTIAGTNQYSKLQTIMAGCSEQAAKGGQSFSDYASALENCSGTAGKMAGTMLDNLNGKMTLFESAADGLEIAVGEQLTPAMSDLYEVGADVLSGMTEFVNDNPGVVKGITTMVGIIGTATAGLTGYVAVAGVAKAVTAAIGATAAASLGPIALGVAGIAAVAGAFVAVTSAADAAVEASGDWPPALDEITTAANGVTNALDDANATMQASAETTMATAGTADLYITKLEEMGDYSTAGPKGGYIAKAKAVSNDIADVLPNSPTPGEVRIYVLMEDGTIAGQEVKNAVLAACNADETRPLTDHVLVEDPETVEYDIDTTYYLNRGGPSAADVQSEVNAAVDAYVKWQAGKLGRDINPSELTRRMMVNGVKRVVIRSPVYTELRSGNVATDASGRVALADLTDTVPQVGKLRGRTVTSGGYEDE